MIDFDYTSVRELLAEPKKVVITTHVSPDGDAIGSSLAMALFLRKLGHVCTVVTPDEYPEFLHWLPKNKDVIRYENNQPAGEKAVQEAELIFCLDFNSPHRMSGLRKLIEASTSPKILIDHHQEAEQWTEVMYSDSNASSTCELIYRFIDGLDRISELDEEIGACLYAGMVTDTGSFKFPSTTPATLRIAAHLMELGVDGSKIQNLIYDNSSEDRLRLMGYALTEKLTIFKEFKVAVMGLSAEELARFNYKAGDTEGLVNYPLSIASINVSIFISEKGGDVRLSFRSKGKIAVHEIARDHFNGGGHINAAGGISDRSVKDTIEKIKSILPQYRQTLLSS